VNGTTVDALLDEWLCDNYRALVESAEKKSGLHNNHSHEEWKVQDQDAKPHLTSRCVDCSLGTVVPRHHCGRVITLS
jgi:hypothetical protein